MKQSFCRACGCTWDNPCWHPDYGNCWWTDETETLCSHCSEENIKDDPATEHCILDGEEYTSFDTF